MLANGGIDTIQVDVWARFTPSISKAWLMWEKVASPDPRLWEATKLWGYPMNVSFVNATAYTVCPGPHLPAQLPHSRPPCIKRLSFGPCAIENWELSIPRAHFVPLRERGMLQYWSRKFQAPVLLKLAMR